MRTGIVLCCCIAMMVGGALLTIGGGEDHHSPDVRNALTAALQQTKEAKINLLKRLKSEKGSTPVKDQAEFWAKEDMADYDRIWSPIADVVAGAIHNGTCEDLAKEWSR